MKHVLIIDAGCSINGKGGTLCHFYADLAAQTLSKLGYSTEITTVDRDFDPQEEAKKVAASDYVILQTPVWWMSVPWQFKKYEDTVFTNPLLCGGDGRSHEKPNRNYGKGGLATKTRYMLSCTWNAPKKAFTRKGDFFEGLGIDIVFLPLHKTFQFIGMSPLKTFMANDVIKNPTHEKDFKRFVKHLEKEFSPVA